MAERISHYTAVGIAIVVQRPDGSLMLIGSKNVRDFSCEFQYDELEGPFLSDRRARARRGDNWHGFNLEINANCRGGVVMFSEQVDLPAAPEQRGIYLPDMSFRALPAPGEREL